MLCSIENVSQIDQSQMELFVTDGDADRVVYFFKNEAGVFQLMDGDKILNLPHFC